ncbi:MAG: DUF11 domain-containing protein, partial [Rariglobus sp.]
ASGTSTVNDVISGIIVPNTAPANNTGTGNNFAESFPFALTKSVVSTNNTGTAGAHVAIGETIRYRLVVTVPYGELADFQLHDALPSGLRFLNNGSASVAYQGAGLSGTVAAGVLADAAVSSSATANTDVYTSGTDVFFKLGTVTNTDASAPASIVIEFDAIVVNETANQNGTVLENTFGIRYDRTGDDVSDVDPTAVSNTLDVEVAEPELTFTKTLVASGSDAGDAVQYTLTITNDAGAAATAFDIRILDTLDDSLDFVSLSVTAGITFTDDSVGDALDLTIASLAPGESVTITINAVVTTLAPAGDTIENSFTATYSGAAGVDADERTGSGTGPNDYADSGFSGTFVLATPTLDKQNASVATATIGQSFIYDILVTLPEGVTRDLIIQDQLPPGLVLVGVTVVPGTFNGTLDATPTVTGGTTSGEDLVIDFGDTTTAADNDATTNTFTIRVEVRVVNEVANQAGGTLANTATLTYTDATSGTTSAPVVDATAPANVTIVEPALTIVQTISDSTPHLGDTITVTVDILNLDTPTGATAHDLRVAGVIPADKFTSIANIVVERYDMGGTIGLADDVVLATLVEGTDYTVTSTAAGYVVTLITPVAENERISITYDATVTSDPSEGLGDDGLFGGTGLNSDSFTSGVTATWTSLPNAPTGERTGADGAGPDATVLNNYSINGDTMITVVGAGLQLVKDDGLASVSAGESWTYTVTITNVGTDTATGVVLTDTIPPQVTINDIRVDGVAVAFTVATDGLGVRTITITLPDIPDTVGNVLEVEFDATLDAVIDVARESITNTASVTHDDIDPTPLDNTDSDNNVIDATPVFVVTKTDGLTSAAPGDSVTYTITIENTGTQNALTNIRDVFPIDQLTFIGVAAFTDSEGVVHAALTAADLVGNELLWTNVALNAGDTLTLTVTATVANPQTQGNVSFTNSVTVTDVANEATPVTGTDTTALPATPDLVVTKVNSTNRIGINDTFTYTITVRNNGDQNATNVKIVDKLPDHVVFVGASNGGVFDAATRTVTWEAAQDPALAVVQGQNLETITYTVTVTLPMNSIVYGTIINQVTVSDDGSNGLDTNPADNDFFLPTDVLGFIYDVSRNYSTSSVFERDGDGEDDPYGLGPVEVYKDAILPIAPIYSGAAEPGATLEVVLHNANGDVIGRQSVVVDTGGNWMASFPGVIVKDYPQSVVITQTPPAAQVEGAAANGYNMRPYYATAINSGHFFRENLNVTRIGEQTASATGEAFQEAINNPIGFNISGSPYETLASPGHPTGR